MSRVAIWAIFFVGLAIGMAPSDGYAQLELPSSAPTPTAPAPAGPLAPVPKSQQKPAKPKIVVPARPRDLTETVLGKALLHNGAAGEMKLVKREDGAYRVTFVVPGFKMSDKVTACRVDISNGIGMKLEDRGRQNGVRRFEIQFPTCQLALDVLNGAMLVSTPGGVCLFEGDDCEANPAGMWGPSGDTLEKSAAATDAARGAADRQIHDYYKTLFSRDRSVAARKQLAEEQVAFPAERERICRDYATELGALFCAARLSEARADALADLVGAKPKVEKQTPAKDAAKPSN